MTAQPVPNNDPSWDNGTHNNDVAGDLNTDHLNTDNGLHATNGPTAKVSGRWDFKPSLALAAQLYDQSISSTSDYRVGLSYIKNIALAPSGLPSDNRTSIVAHTQDSVATRLGRRFATIMFNAAHSGASQFVIARGDELVPEVRERICSALFLDPDDSGPVLAELVRELRAASHGSKLGGDWGTLLDTGYSLEARLCS